MEVDQSSLRVNVGDAGKRPRSAQFSKQSSHKNFKKFQRVNKIEESETEKDETNLNAFEPENEEQNPDMNETNDETSSTFIGN